MGDIFFILTFVDEDVPFVRSVSTTVELPGIGTIRLDDASAPDERGIPRILSKKGNQLAATAVVIPGPDAPRAARPQRAAAPRLRLKTEGGGPSMAQARYSLTSAVPSRRPSTPPASTASLGPSNQLHGDR